MAPDLKRFKSSMKNPSLFSNAKHPLPIFLQQNLLDDARVIKQFYQNSSAFCRIFYFQLLKFCYQTNEQSSNSKLDKLILIFQENTSLLSMPIKFSSLKMDPSAVMQLLLEFLELLADTRQDVYSNLCRYPVIDEILVSFFEEFSQKLTAKSSIHSAKIFQQLCYFFEIDIVEFDNCYQFVDTQVYAYMESSQKVFLVFIDQEKACRNTKIIPFQNSQFFNQPAKHSTSSISVAQPVESERITFDRPEIVFQANGSFFKNNKNQTLAMTSETSQIVHSQDASETNILKDRQNFTTKTKQLPVNQIQDNKNYEMDVTTQFTKSFIIDNLPQPYKAKIRQIKAEARSHRKLRKIFFM